MSGLSAIDFLDQHFAGVPNGAWFELTFILPPALSERGPSPITWSYPLGKQTPDWNKVARMNEHGYGVYYSLTAKHRKTSTRSSEKNAAWCSALWVDIDLDAGYFTDLEQAYEAIDTVMQPATCIIASGGGLHALWRIRPVKVDQQTAPQIKTILRNLALKVHGDTAVAELARVFRLPDTINTKPARDGARCEVLDVLPGEYQLDAFQEYAEQPERIPAPRVSIPLPSGAQTTLPRWVLDYLSTGAHEGERNRRLFAAAIAYRDNGYTFGDAARDCGARAAADGLDEREIERTLRSAWDTPLRGTPNLPRSLRDRLRGMLGGS